MIGRTISHYRIIEKLGQGGMGVVYKAEDTKLRRVVALKFLPTELTGDPEAKARFLQEAQAAAALDHPDICTVHEIDEIEGRTFIAMACLDGQSLKERIEQGPLKPDEALDVATHVARGLQAAHEKGIVHRDIKSANIMLTASGQVKIMDFGLAKLAGGGAVTKAGTTLGTTAYMSPEQARGGEADHRTDLWSLGVVLFEMLTGSLPFRGDYEQAILFQILNGAPEPVTAVRSGIPMELERIVTKCLEKDPTERYQSAADLIADLRRLRRTEDAEGTLARPTIAAGRSVSGSARWLRWAIPAVLVIAVAALFMTRKPARDQAAAEKSIAVLPFENMSGSTDDEYFSDGITEDIITQLSKIADLDVISRQSSAQYKNSGKSIRDIGRELRVGAILEGSVRRAGNQVRIVAQLIDARSDRHIWAETYDKEMTEIFSIQSDVAQKIAAALEATLLPAEKARIEKQPTKDLTAYDYYLKGRQYYYRYTSQSNETAIDLFKRALELDPDYALAMAGLADAYGQRVDKFGFSRIWADSAAAISKKAIEKDPKLAEAYKALGLAHQLRGSNAQSRAAYRKALEFDPRCAAALGNLGLIDIQTGNFAEAYGLVHEMLRVDPLIAYNNLCMAFFYVGLEEYARAKEYCLKAIEMQPDLTSSYQGLAMVSLGEGDYPSAIEQIEKALALDPRDLVGLTLAGGIHAYAGNYEAAERYLAAAIAMDSFGICTMTGGRPLAGMALTLWKMGRRDEARRIAARVIELDQRGVAQGMDWASLPYEIAQMYAMDGRRDEALPWLERAIEAGLIYRNFASSDPAFEEMRSDPRFQQLVARMNARLDEEKRLVRELERREP